MADERSSEVVTLSAQCPLRPPNSGIGAMHYLMRWAITALMPAAESTTRNSVSTHRLH
jgi:hypothetical protein